MRVDAARKQRFQPLVDASATKCLFYQRVEAESRQMSFIKHYRMAQRDRLAVIGVLADHIKQHAGSPAIAPIPVKHHRPRQACRNSHVLHAITLSRQFAAVADFIEVDMSNEIWPPLTH